MYAIEVEQEADGRWIAEVSDLPGVMTYGNSRDEAIRKAQALSLRVLAERLEHGEKLDEIGPRMLARIAKRTGLTQHDL
jgi:predicted RNase H-like HicB family nuclease